MAIYATFANHGAKHVTCGSIGGEGVGGYRGFDFMEISNIFTTQDDFSLHDIS